MASRPAPTARSSSRSERRTRVRATPRSSRAGGAIDRLIVGWREDLGDRRVLALSFDDGPSRWTPAVLDLLAENDARATFFVVGRYVEERPDVAVRAVLEGHELGNHTYDHLDCAHEVEHEVVRDQIARTSAAIERVTGVAPRLIRPPYGKDVARVARIGRELGLAPTVLWSAQAWDWEEPRPEEIVERVLRDVAPGAVVLLHDGAPPYDGRSRDGTVAALAQLLPRLRGDGYEVITVSQLLDLR